VSLFHPDGAVTLTTRVTSRYRVSTNSWIALARPSVGCVSSRDVGNLAAFLVSDGAAALTGNVEYVDAGYHIVG
jgi:enoyl-[acyl-carrier-protein] reductase (NADH)